MSDQPKLIIGDDWKKKDDPPAAARPAPAAPQPSGVVVDSDWKSQAQAEKERLAANEKKAETGGAGARGGKQAMPPADFNTLVSSIVTQALLYLGAFPDPETGRAIVSLEHARFNIDLLAVLQDKTKGNVTPEEAEDLQRAIHELRLRYVEIAQAVAEMAAKKGAPGAPGMPPLTPPAPGLR